MESSTICPDLKRKESGKDEESAVSYKKARYEWQIKKSGPTTQDADAAVLMRNEGEEIDETVEEDTRIEANLNVSNTFSKSENSYVKNKLNDETDNNIFSASTEISYTSSVKQEHSENKTEHSLQTCDKMIHASTYSKSSAVVECMNSLQHSRNFGKKINKSQSLAKEGNCSQNFDHHEILNVPANEVQSFSCGQCHANRSNDTVSTSSSGVVPAAVRPNELDVFLTRRQNHHVAKAVVDNAINKTLEEMGVSPELDTDGFTAEKSHIEDEGICQAIRSQGLIPQQQPDYQLHIPPFISHLQQASELIFSPPFSGQTNTRISRSLPISLHSHIENSSETNNVQVSTNNSCNREGSDASSDVPVSSNDLLDHAVSMAICSQGLALQEEG